jgi:hypothetical protein
MRDWSTLATIVQKLRNLENELYGAGKLKSRTCKN